MTTGMTTLGEYQPVNETIAIGGRCSDNKAAELCGQLESDDNVAVVSDDDSVLDPDYNIHDVDDSLMDDTDCSEGEQNAASSKYGTKKSKPVTCPVSHDAGSSVQIIPKGKAKQGCKQSYDKWNYCIFCSKEIRSKLSRLVSWSLTSLFSTNMAISETKIIQAPSHP